MTVVNVPYSNYFKQLDLYTEYTEDLNGNSKFVIDADGDEMWGVSEYDQGVIHNQYDHNPQDTIVIDDDHSVIDNGILIDYGRGNWEIKDSIPNAWEIKDPMPPNGILVIEQPVDNAPIYLEGISPLDMEFGGHELIVGNGDGITFVENTDIILTLPYIEEMDEYQKMDKDFNKHLAHIIQKLKPELTNEVVAIGEGKCKSELIEEKIDWFINLLRKE